MGREVLVLHSKGKFFECVLAGVRARQYRIRPASTRLPADYVTGDVAEEMILAAEQAVTDRIQGGSQVVISVSSIENRPVLFRLRYRQGSSNGQDPSRRAQPL